MAPADDFDRETAEAIGRLGALIEGLNSRIEATVADNTRTLNHFADAWGEKDRQATVGNQRLYDKMEETREEAAETRSDVRHLLGRIESLQDLPEKFAALERKVEPLIADMSAIKPLVAKLDKAHTQGETIAGFGKLIIGIFGGALGMAILKKLGWL